MTTRLLQLALLLIIPSFDALAQETALKQGDRVRFVVNTGLQFAGTLLGASGDSITVRSNEGDVAQSWPVGAIERFEVYRGTRANKNAILIGAGAGGLLGLLYGLAGKAFSEGLGEAFGGTTSDGGDDMLVALVTLGGVAAGALVGAVIHRRERWEPVLIQPMPVPTGHGLGVTLGLRAALR